MGTNRYGENHFQELGLLAETVPGVLETSAAYPIQLSTGATLVYNTTINTDTTAGYVAALSADVQYSSAGLSLVARNRYGDNRRLVFAHLNETIPAPVSLIFAAGDIDVALGQTPYGGGPLVTQLQAATGTMDPLIDYNGATANSHPLGGVEQFAFHATGFTAPANNTYISPATIPIGYRRIQSVWDDTVTARLDIPRIYTAGSTVWPAMVAETNGAQVVISVGIGGGMRKECDERGQTFSALVRWCSMPNYGGWSSISGLFVNNLSGPSWTGTGEITLSVDLIAGQPMPVSDTDPTGQGFDRSAVFATPQMLGGRDVKMVALHPLQTEENLILSGTVCTGFTPTAAANRAAVEDIAGLDTPAGATAGAFSNEIALAYRQGDIPLLNRRLSEIGTKGTQELVAGDVLLRDPEGNVQIWGYPKLTPGYNGPVGGTAGATTGSITLTSSLLNGQGGASGWIFQEL